MRMKKEKKMRKKEQTNLLLGSLSGRSLSGGGGLLLSSFGRHFGDLGWVYLVLEKGGCNSKMWDNGEE